MTEDHLQPGWRRRSNNLGTWIERTVNPPGSTVEAILAALQFGPAGRAQLTAATGRPSFALAAALRRMRKSGRIQKHGRMWVLQF